VKKEKLSRRAVKSKTFPLDTEWTKTKRNLPEIKLKKSRNSSYLKKLTSIARPLSLE